jgi:hypothetical protein
LASTVVVAVQIHETDFTVHAWLSPYGIARVMKQ